MLSGKNVLLVVTGGIAAYKTPDLVRRLKAEDCDVTCVLSESAAQFVTPLALQSVSGNRVYRDLFSLTDENEMGHIRLAREADAVVIAPATANTLAKLAHGVADDLISTVVLATTEPVLFAPAMNWAMWENNATQDNAEILESRGFTRIGPDTGQLACGEEGPGRMASLDSIVDALGERLGANGPLKGLHAVVTSGPTVEPIDPVRYIANRSSGKQGHAIAGALHQLGARVTLVTGPVHIAPPDGVEVVAVETANAMLAAVMEQMPADIFVAAAAVSDWRAEHMAVEKIKKAPGRDQKQTSLKLTENPDILKTIATLSASGKMKRPRLVVGFAAETENVVESARTKLAAKGCDWICANDVSPAVGTFGSDSNTIHLVSRTGIEAWETLSKEKVAQRLCERIADTIKAENVHRLSGDAS